MMCLLRQLRPTSLAFIAGLLAVPGSALAEPGDHIKLGTNTELAPDLDVGFQYRTNINQNSTEPVGGLNLTIAPGARLTYETPGSKVSLTGDYKIVKYFTSRLSRADQFNDFDVNFDGAFLRDQPVGLYLKERPSLVNNNSGDLGNTPFHTRFRNSLAGGFQIRPGPVLQFDVGGDFQYDNIQVPPASTSATADTRGLNSRIGGGAVLKSEWKFLPRTSVVLDSDFTHYDWQKNVVAAGDSGAVLALPDSNHFRIMSGLRGRLTERVVVVGQLGYGSASYSEKSVTDACGGQPGCSSGTASGFGAKLKGVERLLAVFQVQFEIAEGRSLSIGYRKDFDDVFFSNYMAYNRVYGTVSSDFGTRVKTSATASIRQESYRGEVSRNDVFVDVGATAGYQIREWAALSGGVTYQQRVSPSAAAVSYSDVQPRVLMTFTY